MSLKKPLLSLVMIVRDESSNIRQVLEAAKPFIDHATIVDTGSTDDTKELVEAILPDAVIVDEPFVDFATTRNLSLEIDANFPEDERCEFQLVLSGDEFLRDGKKLREYLETQRDTKVDLHRIRISIDDSTFLSPRIFRTGSEWKYTGAVHEYPVHPDEKAPIGNVPKAVIEHVVSDHEKRYASIWEHHIPLLQAQLEENPKDERALIFLAQSYENLMGMMQDWERVKYAMEAMSLYMRRLAIPTGIDAERNYLKMRYLTCARYTQVYTDEEVLARCKELYDADPKRPETAMLLVHAASRVLPVAQVYELASNAARVAAEAVDIENCSPVSGKIGWQANFLAAKAAKRLSEKFPDVEIEGMTYADLTKKHISAGLAAGGQWDMFKTIEAPPAPVVKENPPEQTTAP